MAKHYPHEVDLSSKLAEARDELFEYDRMVETGMINGPEYVVDEMVSEIKRLRKALEYYADEANHTEPRGTKVFGDVFYDKGKTAREALAWRNTTRK